MISAPKIKLRTSGVRTYCRKGCSRRWITQEPSGPPTAMPRRIPATVVKAPPETTDRGCTYAAGIGKKYLSQAIRLLDGKNVSHGRAFVLSEDGTYREVWS